MKPKTFVGTYVRTFDFNPDLLLSQKKRFSKWLYLKLRSRRAQATLSYTHLVPYRAIEPTRVNSRKLIAQGRSNREISERLFLALDIVKGHNRGIYDNIQVQWRTEAVACVRELGLLGVQEQVLLNFPPSR